MSELSMNESSLRLQTDQLVQMLGRFMLLKPRLMFVLPLPEDLDRLKERMGELHPEGGPGRVADYGVFEHIGLVLSRESVPLTMGELSEALGVPSSTTTRMVDWMVKSGYVERLPDPQDRRIVRVTLTENGRELYQSINEFIRQHIEQLLRRFTAEERDNLVSSLQKLMKVLEEAAAESPNVTLHEGVEHA